MVNVYKEELLVNDHIIVSEGNDKFAKYIQKKLIEFNMTQVPLAGTIAPEPINIVIQDDDSRLIGGINATLIRYWKRCHVDTFWIDERYRGTGYGKKLLELIEKIALDKGCTLLEMETYSFQAPKFYLKHGYQIIGIVENHPEKYAQYFFKKEISV